MAGEDRIDLLCPIERVGETPSTQADARRLVASGLLGGGARLLVADRQSHGVGRFGRDWASPAGGLWCTLAWPLASEGARQGLGLRAGLAVAEAIEGILGADGATPPVQMKWPNDILVDGRKLAGVLCEVVGDDRGRAYALVGVGVNANSPADALPEALRDGATTLRDIAGREISLDRLLHGLRARLCAALSAEGLDAETLAGVTRRLHRVGERVRVTLGDGSIREGTLLGLTPDGRLRLEIGGREWAAPPGAELAPAGA